MILPKILAVITGKTRYKPEIIWSSKSWVHNIFRVYELIFWRKVGIRAEETTTFHNGIVTHQIHSFEALCAFVETWIRDLLEWRLPIKVWIPILSSIDGLPLPASPFLFAVAFDASAAQRVSVNPNTFAKTCTGSNLLLLGGTCQANGGDMATTFTYNSVTLTQIGTNVTNGAAGVAVWYKASPATGSNNVTTNGFTTYNWTIASSYTGCLQTGIPDSSNTSADTVTTTPKTISTTVVASNCWLFGYAEYSTDTGGGGITAISSNSTDRNSQLDIRNDAGKLFAAVGSDTNTTVPTGSQSMTFNRAATDGATHRWCIILISFAPVVTTTVVNSNLPLIGVG